MSGVIRAVVIIGALTTMACGATVREPVQTPQTTPSTPTEVQSGQFGTLPAGQELDVRLQSPLSSATAQAEQRFEATTVVDVMQNGQTLIPAGAVVRGVVAEVDPATRLDRAGRLVLSFDQLEVQGRSYPIRAMATQVFESGGIRDEAATAGAGAGIGGVIGGVLGGVRGALLGAIIGGGGAILATEGRDIELPAGTIMRIRLDQAVSVR
jgi:hypothetical protein